MFASAAEEEMDTAVKDGLVAGKPEVFVKNREIIMVPKDNPANIKSLQDMAKPDIKLVLAQKDVPAADYALEILGKANDEYGSDFKKDVLSNVVSRESDVRASVNRVVVGDADATFGYASDYTPDIRDRVKVIPIPPDLNIIATYPIAALKDAKDPELAKKWVELVTSKEGQTRAQEVELRTRSLKERGKDNSSPRTLPRGETGSLPALPWRPCALVAGFISLPILSLVVWTISENAWRAMASPVARDALLLSIRTTARPRCSS